MNQRQIKIERTQSVLRELVAEAISNLDDELLKGICVVDVKCSRGKYDAKVYIDKTIYDEKEQKYILHHLNKISPFLQNYCASAEGWYRCPKFHFEFDDMLEHQNKMDQLFQKIENELSKSNNND